MPNKRFERVNIDIAQDPFLVLKATLSFWFVWIPFLGGLSLSPCQTKQPCLLSMLSITRGGVEDTKSSRPRTQKKSEAKDSLDPVEAKDRNARGQGPRTQPLVFSEKKRSSKKFFKQSPIYWRSQNF